MSDHPTKSTPTQQLAALLGPECVVWHESETDPTPRPKTGWVLEDLCFAAHVHRNGDTVAMVDFELSAVMLSLHTRYEGTEQVFPIAEAQNLMEEQLWPKWEERGYKIDRMCHPDNGWDKELNFWTLNVRKRLSTMAEVAEELHWIAQHETIQLWS
jgi:hypothetical protein